MRAFSSIVAIIIWTSAATVVGQSIPGTDIPGKTKVATQDQSGTVPYAGVIPGSSHPPAVKVAPGSTSPAIVTWPGFQMRPDGGSRFFIQITSDVELETKMAQEQFILTLKQTRIASRNNRYALETRFFNTPVTRAQLEKKGKDTTMILSLREHVFPDVKKEVAPDGYHFIFIDFPAGNYLGTEPTSDTAQSTQTPTNKSPSQDSGLTKEQMKSLDDEKPPALKGKAKGSFKLSTGGSSKKKSKTSEGSVGGKIKLFK